jgi:hypothetical protein
MSAGACAVDVLGEIEGRIATRSILEALRQSLCCHRYVETLRVAQRGKLCRGATLSRNERDIQKHAVDHS